MTLAQITKAMQTLEVIISREQQYINKCGEQNDANPDQLWIEYKERAENNLATWDNLKAKRDQLKATA